MRKRDIYLIFGTKIAMHDRWAIYCTIIYTFWIFFLWHQVYIYVVFISSPLNFSCPLDDDRASILRDVLYMCFVL